MDFKFFEMDRPLYVNIFNISGFEPRWAYPSPAPAPAPEPPPALDPDSTYE
jgi:hypothetical protein